MNESYRHDTRKVGKQPSPGGRGAADQARRAVRCGVAAGEQGVGTGERGERVIATFAGCGLGRLVNRPRHPKFDGFI